MLLLTLLLPIIVRANTIDLTPTSKSAILIEPVTGSILYQKNIKERLEPASMTKMMSMLLIVEAFESGKLKWDEKISISENAAGFGGSQIFLKPGETMVAQDLFKALAIASANDATVALAEKVAGSEEMFVNQMNAKSRELKLTDTHFANSTGLTAENHYSSAKDMSIIARALSKHDVIFKYTSVYEDYLRTDTANKFWLVNTNKLVRFYQGMDGFKTGFTNGAMYCLTATAKRDNMRLISVVMGSDNIQNRNNETVKMLDYGFSQYMVTPIYAKHNILGKVSVKMAKVKTVKIVPVDDIVVLSEKSNKSKTIKHKLVLDEIKPPVKKGDKVGEVHVYVNNKLLFKKPVTVLEKVLKANLLDLYKTNLKDYLTGDIYY